MFGIYADNANNAFSLYDLAFVAHLLNRWSDFHYLLLNTFQRQSRRNYANAEFSSAEGSRADKPRSLPTWYLYTDTQTQYPV